MVWPSEFLAGRACLHRLSKNGGETHRQGEVLAHKEICVVHDPQSHQAKPAKWTYHPLPQRKVIDGLQVGLETLRLSTNRAPKQSTAYWEPAWSVQREGADAIGWREPEWSAEDSTGNRGQFLGTNHVGLRFSAQVFPETTNVAAAKVVLKLPKFSLATLGAGKRWNRSRQLNAGAELTALGVFPAGTRVFSEGKQIPNTMGMGPVRGGGAPSGWTGMSKWETPLKQVFFAGHYSHLPVIYLKYPDAEIDGRLGMRLTDDQGRLWSAEPEQQGVRQDIHPFLLQLPADVKSVVPEVVDLKPLRARFTVKTP